MGKFFQLKDGMKIAFQEWGAGNLKKVLSVHGWLDNSNSFSYLGPKIANEGFHYIALDLPGHGHSSHFAKEANYSPFKSVAYMNEIMDDFLDWKKANIIGHSMGAGISFMLAGTFPEKVEKLVAIDLFGLWTRPAEQAAKGLRTAILAEQKMLQLNKPPKVYSTLATAIEARIKSTKFNPGEQTISREAAMSILSRLFFFFFFFLCAFNIKEYISFILLNFKLFFIYLLFIRIMIFFLLKLKK
jgi:pimeloyl-ACP methyl ester carboxylesterase